MCLCTVCCCVYAFARTAFVVFLNEVMARSGYSWQTECMGEHTVYIHSVYKLHTQSRSP